MVLSDNHSRVLNLIGNPVKFSKTPVTYRRSPPVCGADTEQVLAEWLDTGQA